MQEELKFKLAIGVAATKSYLYAFKQCVRNIAAAGSHHERAMFILATDKSDEAQQAIETAREELPEGWAIQAIQTDLDDTLTGGKYDVTPQIRIATLQGQLYAFARKIRAEQFFSVESDTLIPPNALKVLEWTLEMPREDGTPFYDIAAGTYNNGLFLGGFGSYQNQIEEDFLLHERIVPKALLKERDSLERKVIQLMKDPEKNKAELEVRHTEGQDIMRRIKECPPDGNIWQVTAKHGWRRRGWMDFAYPGIGEGAVVPSDWCGLGCTLMNKRALSLADYQGYQGKGTQDLFLCWEKWHPAGLKIACVPHVVASHVKRVKDDKGNEVFENLIGYHEQQPEYKGHLRLKKELFIKEI